MANNFFLKTFMSSMILIDEYIFQTKNCKGYFGNICEAYHQLGAQYYKEGNLNDAIKQYIKYANATANDIFPHLCLAKIYYEQKNSSSYEQQCSIISKNWYENISGFNCLHEIQDCII